MEDLDFRIAQFATEGVEPPVVYTHVYDSAVFDTYDEGGYIYEDGDIDVVDEEFELEVEDDTVDTRETMGDVAIIDGDVISHEDQESDSTDTDITI